MFLVVSKDDRKIIRSMLDVASYLEVSVKEVREAFDKGNEINGYTVDEVIDE